MRAVLQQGGPGLRAGVHNSVIPYMSVCWGRGGGRREAAGYAWCLPGPCYECGTNPAHSTRSVPYSCLHRQHKRAHTVAVWVCCRPWSLPHSALNPAHAAAHPACTLACDTLSYNTCAPATHSSHSRVLPPSRRSRAMSCVVARVCRVPAWQGWRPFGSCPRAWRRLTRCARGGGGGCVCAVAMRG